VVLVVGLLITAAFAIGARLLRNDNEDRLLKQRVNEAATVAASSVGSTHATLASSAALAEATRGNTTSFKQLTTPLTANGVPYVSVSLWRVGDPASAPLVVVGAPPELARKSPAEIRTVLDHATSASNLAITNLLGGKDRRLGYAAAVGPDAKYVTYAEAHLPRNRKARIATNSAFADFNYALYLGDRPDPHNLLASSNGGGDPIPGRHASVAVPFGDQKLLLVLAPRAELGGTLLLRLPWVLGLLGLVITVAAAAIAERLIRQREHAENLARELEKIAAENARLLADQRTVAQTLQHSLLPDAFPDTPGLELGVRYVAGVEGVDIGGDWYDVIVVDDGPLIFVVGDVSGRGLRAATVMASLRFAIRAYAVQGDSPTDILTKLSKLLDVGRDGSFATVLCGSIDLDTRQMTVASAGHPFPLLVADGDAEFLDIRPGVPVGVDVEVPYVTTVLTIPPHATLLVYTDGLIERRGENLDVGLARLRTTVLASDGSLEHLLTEVVDGLSEAGSDDDTAVLGVRWRT
jgi:serine phosphatase RsbU (regulator of sigma subunit)